jgi:hypothetical protein
MSADNSPASFVESPPYSKVLQTPHSQCYNSVKVSLRVDESWLARAVQQPQVSEPRQLVKCSTLDVEYSFSFAVTYGCPHDSEHGARVTVQCNNATKPEKKVQFDVVTGPSCRIENLVTPRNLPLSLLVSVNPVVGEVAQRSEKLYTFFFVVFLASAVKGETNTSLVHGEMLTLLPTLTTVDKPKRPRGRPRVKRASSPDDGSLSGSANSAETSSKSPKKKRTLETTTAELPTPVQPEKRARPTQVDEPRNVQRAFATAAAESSSSTTADAQLSFATVERAYKDSMTKKPSLLRRTESTILPRELPIVESQ